MNDAVFRTQAAASSDTIAIGDEWRCAVLEHDPVPLIIHTYQRLADAPDSVARNQIRFTTVNQFRLIHSSAVALALNPLLRNEGWAHRQDWKADFPSDLPNDFHWGSLNPIYDVFDKQIWHSTSQARLDEQQVIPAAHQQSFTLWQLFTNWSLPFVMHYNLHQWPIANLTYLRHCVGTVPLSLLSRRLNRVIMYNLETQPFGTPHGGPFDKCHCPLLLAKYVSIFHDTPTAIRHSLEWFDLDLTPEEADDWDFAIDQYGCIETGSERQHHSQPELTGRSEHTMIVRPMEDSHRDARGVPCPTSREVDKPESDSLSNRARTDGGQTADRERGAVFDSSLRLSGNQSPANSLARQSDASAATGTSGLVEYKKCVTMIQQLMDRDIEMSIKSTELIGKQSVYVIQLVIRTDSAVELPQAESQAALNAITDLFDEAGILGSKLVQKHRHTSHIGTYLLCTQRQDVDNERFSQSTCSLTGDSSVIPPTGQRVPCGDHKDSGNDVNTPPDRPANRNISPIIISSDDDLQDSSSRQHASMSDSKPPQSLTERQRRLQVQSCKVTSPQDNSSQQETAATPLDQEQLQEQVLDDDDIGLTLANESRRVTNGAFPKDREQAGDDSGGDDGGGDVSGGDEGGGRQPDQRSSYSLRRQRPRTQKVVANFEGVNRSAGGGNGKGARKRRAATVPRGRGRPAKGRKMKPDRKNDSGTCLADASESYKATTDSTDAGKYSIATNDDAEEWKILRQVTSFKYKGYTWAVGAFVDVCIGVNHFCWSYIREIRMTPDGQRILVVQWYYDRDEVITLAAAAGKTLNLALWPARYQHVESNAYEVVAVEALNGLKEVEDLAVLPGRRLSVGDWSITTL